MRNYQLRKTNNELTLKKIFFLVNNKWGKVGTVYILYKPLFSMFLCCFTNFPEF